MRRRIVGLTLTLVLVFAAMTGALHFYREHQTLLELSRQRLQAIAVTAAEGLDGDAHAELNDCMDQACPNYAKVASYLRRVQAHNGLMSEIYTLARAGEGTRFVVRTKRESAFGLPYELREEMRPVFDEGRATSTGFYSDQYGTWVSAYAPIRDSRGKVVALLEADYQASELFAAMRAELVDFGTVTLLGLLLTFLLADRLTRRLTRPLTQLADAVEETGRGDSTTPIPTSAPDEIGALARRFEAMRTALERTYTQERLALVGKMVNGTFHDVRGPLSNILGLVHLLKREADAARRASISIKVGDQVARIECMCRDVLDFSRGKPRLDCTTVSLSVLLEDVVADIKAVAGNPGVRVVAPVRREGEIWGDREKLRRVLGNLLKNAIEASPREGTVRIGLHRDAGLLGISVTDEGPGIPEEQLSRLFEPFYTHGKTGGTGLGLNIARTFVEAHGGSITVVSGPGEGATFRIDLPAVAAAAGQGPRSKAAAHAA